MLSKPKNDSFKSHRMLLLIAALAAISSISCQDSGSGTESAGRIVWRGLHTPCGEELPTSPENAPKYTFTGYEEDTALSWLDAGARMFSSTTCRFTGIDPKKKPGVTSYAYAANNPLKYVDPDGQEEKTNAAESPYWKSVGGGRILLKVYNPAMRERNDKFLGYDIGWTEGLTDLAWDSFAAPANMLIMGKHAIEDAEIGGVNVVGATVATYFLVRYGRSAWERLRFKPPEQLGASVVTTYPAATNYFGAVNEAHQVIVTFNLGDKAQTVVAQIASFQAGSQATLRVIQFGADRSPGAGALLRETLKGAQNILNPQVQDTVQRHLRRSGFFEPGERITGINWK